MSLEIQTLEHNQADERNDGNDSRDSDDNDSTTSSSSSYVDPSTNDLTTITGAALIVADCMGTGILALPNNINVTLGRNFGLFFLILNVLVNLYAGTILCSVALVVEKRFCGMYTSITDGKDQDHESVEGGDGDGITEVKPMNIVAGDDRSGNGASQSIGKNTAGNNDGIMDWNYNNADDDLSESIDQSSIGASGIEDSDLSTNFEGDNDHQQQEERYQTSARTSRIVLNDRDDCDADGDGDDYDNMEQLKKPISKNSLLEHQNDEDHRHHNSNHGAHTFDFIGITTALFNQPDEEKEGQQQNCNKKSTLSKATILVTITYYTNIFLVLGNYILVMSHAVAAMFGENNICLPNAGLIASTLMFGLCQLRSMSSLGRIVSFVSLLALAIVVVQCIASIQSGQDAFMYDDSGGFGGGERMRERRFLQDEEQQQEQQQQGTGVGGEEDSSLFVDQSASYNLLMFQSIARQFAALSSIGFAVGSQKLLLNIRHEYRDRTQAAPQSLGIALLAFGSVYAFVCIFSGPNPPSFLFDAISPGFGRRVAGFLLW
eukprot:CAMPEP_0203664834 /NCGR_PEP_ID=MMETSP0090-20130426/2171_1 /ASSEMBLY_ACC=CAM_ASM_001088 /TAXON_ID=426623 /ORGANISM="Chaetoceros affinis, Strain CCMP159" /LENGTH=545 /DNA_ID=CAMNT_0050528211 /DNA_START=27 /DNA_END=1661 /DNA_ORIENTATION=+